jgi:hypothetical protein
MSKYLYRTKGSFRHSNLIKGMLNEIQNKRISKP